MRRKLRVVLALAAVVSMAAVQPAQASRFGPAGPPQFPSMPFEERLGSGGPPNFIQDTLNPNKWVWTIDPSVYGATGTITFYNHANAITGTGTMSGPGGAGVNDFQVCNALDVCSPGRSAFDFDRPSFTQDVDSVEADFNTPDPTHDMVTDWDPTVYHPDGLAPPSIFSKIPGANIDGSANLYKFGFTVAPGTQFMNMQVDRSGNYYVARRDMQWEWIDTFRYKVGSEIRVDDTQFNIQPYPISDAHGWCGALTAQVDPNDESAMAGQLIKDIAFDVWAKDDDPGVARPVTTEVVPSFVMRSYGRYEVDVTMLSTGVRQRFTGIAKGVHFRNDGSKVQPTDPDYGHWRNRVSPFAAGVVPRGAWVINPGSPYMQVVPAGTPGATWHQNKFAGAAFLVRGDMERRVNYINAPTGWAGDQTTVSDTTQVYKSLIDAEVINPKTGQKWKRADWNDWAPGGQTVLPDAY